MRYIYIVFVFAGLFSYLQFTQAYYFYYIEQLQLFLSTWQYAVETLCQIGGCVEYLSRWACQFFVCPGVGALVMAALLTFIVFLLQKVLERLMGASSYFLSALPVVPLLYLLSDRSYLLQGTWALAFMLSFLWGYTAVARWQLRLVVGLLLQLALFAMAGPVAFLFSVMAFVYELLADRRHCWRFLLLPVVMLAAGGASVYLRWVGELRFALTPDAYYDPLLHSPTMLYSWYALLISLLAAGLCRRLKQPEGKLAFLWPVVSFSVLAGMVWLLPERDNKIDLEQDYYLRHKEWDKIVSSFQAGQPTVQWMNILNLALAKQGKLGDSLMDYPQNESGSLLGSWDHSVGNAIALADIYYHIGDIASAQKLAFEGYLSSLQGGNPRLLQLLVKANLIFGAYPVAEKYLNLLEHTFYYKEWAMRYRSYLSDAAVEADAELGGKRKALSKEGRYAVSPRLTEVLEQLAVNNPDEPLAIQYLAGFYLVNRNLKAYASLLDRYYRTDVWPSLSVIHQQAVVALLQDKPGEWVKRGVNLKVERQFNLFDRDMQLYHRQPEFKQIMAEKHGHTYWYYLMFRKAAAQRN